MAYPRNEHKPKRPFTLHLSARLLHCCDAATHDITVRNGTPSVVGYASSSNPSAKAYVMVASSFQDVGQTTLDINKIATTATPATYKTRAASAPLLKVWDPTIGTGVYTTYYYIDDCEDPEDEDNEITAWATNKGEYPEDVVLPLGSALWYICQTETGKDVTLAGEISSEDDITVQATTAGYTMIANPFPAATDINKITWKAADGTSALAPATYKTRTTAAPQIKVWDPTVGTGVYTTYYYISDCEDPEDEDEEITAWATNKGEYPSGVTIPAGQGFWLALPSTYTGAKAKFTSPIAKE